MLAPKQNQLLIKSEHENGGRPGFASDLGDLAVLSTGPTMPEGFIKEYDKQRFIDGVIANLKSDDPNERV